jgi:hypothetical protein
MKIWTYPLRLILHQLEDLSPNNWVLPFTARITVSCIPSGERAVPFLSRSTSSQAENPDHTVFTLRGLLGVSLPAEKSLLSITDEDIRVQVEAVME